MVPQDLFPLIRVLPDSRPFDGPDTYCLHVAMLFKSCSLVHEEIYFTRMALSLTTPDSETSALWQALIKGYADLGLYDDAYASWTSTPYDDM